MNLAGYRSLAVLPIILLCVVASLATVKTEDDYNIITSLNREGTNIEAHLLQRYSTGAWGSLKVATLTPAKYPVQAYNFLISPQSTMDNILLDTYYIPGTNTPFKLARDRYDVDIQNMIVMVDRISSRNYPGVYGSRILENPCTEDFRGIVFEQNGWVKARKVNNSDNPFGISWNLYPSPHQTGDIPIDVSFSSDYSYGAQVVFNQAFGYRLDLRKFNEELEPTLGVSYRLGENVVDIAVGNPPPNKDFFPFGFGSFRTNSSGRAEYRYGGRNIKLADFSISGNLKIFKNYTVVDDPFLQSKNMIVSSQRENKPFFFFSYIQNGSSHSFVQELNANGGKTGAPKPVEYDPLIWRDFRTFSFDQQPQ